MSYTVLARKYRPQTFADLVGQAHVSRTLGNAITSERVAHAFLFTGARGVGKTTTARLLAKALNCERGPTPAPCNQCDACREIALGTDIDVLEIDGASNNSVDDVRRLQETLPFRPARDRFKVVIVDEVHMLSAGAFNAFLKTLEEPPSHVKFIFATTEIHKVPITIRSRCQRYDFRLIPHAVISARLREILGQEHIEADEDAITLVAREAGGSMRDALTVLDQVLALGSERLEGDAVAQGLGIAGRKHVWGTLAATLAGDAAGCLRSVTRVAEQGLDVLHFARTLLECARDLVVLKIVNLEDELLELSPDERAIAKGLADPHSREELERLFSGLSLLVEEVGLAGMPKLALEMGLVRLADRPPLLPLRELLERLAGLEARLGSSAPSGGSSGARGGSRVGGGSGFAPQGRGPTSAAPPASTPAPTNLPRPALAISGAHASSTATVQATAFVAPEPATPAPAPASVLMQAEPARPPAPLAPAPAPSLAAALAAPPPPAAAETVRGSAVDGAEAVRGSAMDGAETARGPAVDGAAPVSSAAGGAERANGSGPAAHATDDVLGGAWLQIVTQLKTSQPALAAVLDHGTPFEVSPTCLRIGFPENSFFGRQAHSSSAREGILRAAEVVLGARPELQLVRSGESSAPTLAGVEESSRKARATERRQVALQHPRVQEALEVFEESEQSIDIQVEE